jgi:hypothetical protein
VNVTENIKFLIQISGLTSVLLLVSLVPVWYFGNSRIVWGVFYGYLVSLANILFSFFSIKWAFNKSTTTFFAVVIGGMGARFLLLATVMFIVWKFVQVPLAAFAVSLAVFYLTLQFFEIRFIQKELQSKKTAYNK